MALTLGNTNYDGTVSEVLHAVLGVGNELADKDTVYVETGVDAKRALPRISSTEYPLGEYVATPAVGDQTDTTTYAERDLVVEPGMHYERFLPNDFLSIWPEYQSVGDFSNLQMNPTFWSRILGLKQNKIGSQVSKLFWQGDTASLTPGLAICDGIIKQATADAAVIDVVNVGLIVKSNVVAIIEAVWAAIPVAHFDNPNFNIHMSTSAFKQLQQFNNDAKKTTVGVLSQVVEDLFLSKRIKHYAGMPHDVIIAADGSNSPTSNLVLGVWVPVTDESPRVNRLANDSDEWFIKINYKIGAGYRAGEEIVMYSGAIVVP